MSIGASASAYIFHVRRALRDATSSRRFSPRAAVKKKRVSNRCTYHGGAMNNSATREFVCILRTQPRIRYRRDRSAREDSRPRTVRANRLREPCRTVRVEHVIKCTTWIKCDSSRVVNAGRMTFPLPRTVSFFLCAAASLPRASRGTRECS